MSLRTILRAGDQEHAAEEERERQSNDLRQRQRERFAMSSSLPELKRSDLTFARFSVVVHEPTGDQFRIYRGEISTGPTHPVSAFFYDEAGGIVFLERLPGDRR